MRLYGFLTSLAEIARPQFSACACGEYKQTQSRDRERPQVCSFDWETPNL